MPPCVHALLLRVLARFRTFFLARWGMMVYDSCATIQSILKEGFFMITPDMSIASVMKLDPEVAPVFMSYGMHCLYCPHASAESIAEASLVHGINADELVKALNAYFDKKNP